MGWLRLNDHYGNGSNLVAISAFNFVRWFDYDSKVAAICRYDTLKNEWNKIADTERFIYHNRPQIAYNAYESKLYIHAYRYWDEEAQFAMYDIETDTLEQIKVAQPTDDNYISKPYIIDINSKINLVGGLYGNSHFSWDSNQHKLEEIYKFNEIVESSVDNSGCLVYVKSKQLLLLLGGCHRGSSTISTSIWSHTIGSKVWKTLQHVKMPFATHTFGAVLTIDEKYIITFGGFSFYSSDDIWILNVDSMEWKRSPIKCPYAGACHTILMGDKLNDDVLICGYVRQTVRAQNPHISNDLIGLINSYFCLEFVHLLTITMEMMSEPRHYKINVNEIINSISAKQKHV